MNKHKNSHRSQMLAGELADKFHVRVALEDGGSLPDGTPRNSSDFQLGSSARAEPSDIARTGTSPEQIFVMTLNENNVWEYIPEGSAKEAAQAKERAWRCQALL